MICDTEAEESVPPNASTSAKIPPIIIKTPKVPTIVISEQKSWMASREMTPKKKIKALYH